MENSNYKIKTVVMALVSVFSVAVVICVSYLIYRLWNRSRKVKKKHFL